MEASPSSTWSNYSSEEWPYNASVAETATASPTHVEDLYNYWVWSITDGTLMVIILGGNTLTILAVTLSRRLSALVSNQFVLNLAVSDFMVGFTLPYHLCFYINDYLGTIKWTCLLRFILIILACLASIYNLIAIAVDRYIAIVHPLHYSRYMTKAVTRLIMGATWTTAVCISIIPIFWNEWEDNASCEMNVVIPKQYTTTLLAPTFCLIWMVMFVLYWRIWREAACHAKRMRTNTCSPSGPNDWKSIQVVLLVLGSFSICWMPFVVVACAQTLPTFNPHSPVVYRLTFMLAVSNSGINPIIYAWKNAGFRAAFARLLRCKGPDSSEYRGATSPAVERKRTSATAGSVALQEGGVLPGGGRVARLTYTVDEEATDVARCRIIENAGYQDVERGDSNPSYLHDTPTPVHRPTAQRHAEDKAR